MATFVHVSDLHFGNIDATDDSCALDAYIEPWIAKFPWFDGYLGHSGAALRDLDSFFDALRTSERADLVVTGDLTTVGAATEFALADEYLGSYASLSSGMRLGLNVSDYLQRAIPGNHDCWPGRRAEVPWDPVMWGPPPAGGFPMPCPTVTYTKCGSSIEVAFVRINSEAEVHPWGLQRLLARASFSRQLTDAAQHLRKERNVERQVRVLLLHHSPSHPGFILGMSRKMRQELDEFMKAEDIRLVLTGHVHKPVSFRRKLGSRTVLEVRCGTTTQRDTIPPNWTTRARPPDPNALFVHRLNELSNKTLSWEADCYVRTDAGFVRTTRYPVKGSWANAKIQVWP